jgi:hypothetical protein
MAFLGLSSSIVGEVSKTISGWVQNPFNRNFLYWYFFPALAFMLFHQFVIRQVAYGETPPNPIEYANQAFAVATPNASDSASDPFATPDPFGGDNSGGSLGGDGSIGGDGQPSATATPQSNFALPADSGSTSDYFVALLFSFLGVDLFNYVLIPFVIGVLLNAISFQITQFYEGFVPPVSWLLMPLKLRNQKRSKDLYGPLFEKRVKYLELYRAERKASEAEAANPGADALAPVGTPKASDLKKQLRDIKREIQALHETIEKKGGGNLPNDPARVAATEFGNTLASAEEYAFDRYGMDGVLFWPRLRAELDADTLMPIDNAKSQVDGMLNFSVLAYIAAIYAVVSIFLMPVALKTPDQAWRIWMLVGVAVVALGIGYGSYRGAVGAAANMGAMMRSYFDHHRDKVLEKFSLRRPDKLEDEKIIWYKLGAFIRRGESFYFPEEAETD